MSKKLTRNGLHDNYRGIDNYVLQKETITKNVSFGFGGGFVVAGKAIDKLAAYENAEEEGRLFIVPKGVNLQFVGDMIIGNDIHFGSLAVKEDK